METQIIIAIISSGLLTTIINRLFDYWDKRNGVQNGIRVILKDRIRWLCTRYIEQGWIYEDELEDLVKMHDCYHKSLKGNGYLDSLMHRVGNLEIRGIGIK